MTRQDWDDLALEREAIMQFCAGIESFMAKELAKRDTAKRFGPRPTGGKTK